MDAFVALGAAEEVTPTPETVVSPAFVIRQGEKRRLIFDPRTVNEAIPCPSFRMERLVDVPGLWQQGDWMCTVDITKAYLHVPLAAEARRYLAFRANGRTYSFTSLPFGLNIAPRTFTLLLKPVVVYMRGKGVRLLIYLDDLIIFARTAALAREHTRALIALLASLGFLISPKSVTTPSQRIRWIGFLLDSTTLSLCLPAGKVESLRKGLLTTARRAQPKARHLSSVIGDVVHASTAIPAAIQYVRAAMRALKEATRRPGRWDSPCPLPAEAREHMKELAGELEGWNGRHHGLVVPSGEVERVMTTDASHWGWGGVVTEGDRTLCTFQGSWNECLPPGTPPLHINELELRAVLLTLERALQENAVPPRSFLCMMIDSTTALRYVKRRGGPVPHLDAVSLEITRLLARHAVQYRAEYVATEENTADELSRHAMWDWGLHPDVMDTVFARFGTPEIDLFASPRSAVLPDYLSFGGDSFTADWSAYGLAWANPPLSLVQRVLEKAAADECTLLLVAPRWPSRPWWPVLESRLDPATPPLTLSASMPARLRPGSSYPEVLDRTALVIARVLPSPRC